MHLPNCRTTLGILLALAAACGAQAAEPKDAPADLLFEYAEGLYRDGLHKLAIPELTKFLNARANDPRASRAWFYLGECFYLAKKDYKAALPAFEQAARDPKLPQHAVALYRIGDCRFRLGAVAGAVEPLRKFLSADLLTPEHRCFIVHAKYTLARAYFTQRDLKEALRLFQEVLVDTSPDNTYKAYVLLPIGDCLASLGKPDDALARYRELETHLVAAIKQKKEGDPARDARQKLLGNLRTKIATLLLSQNKHTEALTTFGLLADKGPYAAEILYGRAHCLFYLGRYQEALVPALAYLTRFPAHKQAVSALYIVGESYHRTSRFPEAEKRLSQFLAADKDAKHPAREAAAFSRAAAAYQQGKAHAKPTAQAADFFLTHFPKSTHVPDVHYFSGEAAFWLGQYPPAVDHYTKVPAANRYAEEAAHQIAVCLDLVKLPETAAAAYDFYVTRYGPKGKHYKNALERSARLWGQLRQYAKAAERYGAFHSTFAKPDPKTAEEFLYRKGACEFETKQYSRMYKTFTAYYKLYPNGTHKGDVLYFLAWYHSEQKQEYERAVALFELCAGIPGRHQVRARYLLAHAHNRLGKKLLEAKHKKEADEQFAQAAAIFLDLMRSAPKELAGPAEYVWTAQIFREQRRFPQAIQAYEALIARYPKEASPTVVYWLGQLAITLEPPDHARAEKYFRRFVESFKDHPYYIWAAFGLAEALKGLKKDKEAWDWYQKVEQLAPHVIRTPQKRDRLVLRCILQMGRMAFDSKRHEYARDYLLRVGYLAGGDEAAEALYKAGKAVFALKDTKAAVAPWQRLLRHYRKTTWAEQLIKELPTLGLRLAPDGAAIEHVPAAASDAGAATPAPKPGKEPKAP